MADYGKPGEPESLLPPISEETLAEMIATTRSRATCFMNRFRTPRIHRIQGSHSHTDTSLRQLVFFLRSSRSKSRPRRSMPRLQPWRLSQRRHGRFQRKSPTPVFKIASTRKRNQDIGGCLPVSLRTVMQPVGPSALAQRCNFSRLPIPRSCLECCRLTEMKIQENVPLAQLTTFGIGGPARWFV